MILTFEVSMNKNNAAAYLPLVQAFVEGKTIQEKRVFHCTKFIFVDWFDLEYLNFDKTPDCYRIKPEEDHWATSDAFPDGMAIGSPTFDVEKECRALRIWPISLYKIPDSKMHIKNLHELVAKAIAYGQSLMKSNRCQESAEQQARNMMERMGVEDAQQFSNGEVIELANLIADNNRLRNAQ
jgi:hypothetical protein